MIVCNFARIVPDHNSPLELIDAHGEVTALDGDGGAAIDGATQRLDQVNAGLGADVALAHGAVLGVLAPGAAPDAAEVSRPGHAEAAVRVTWIQGSEIRTIFTRDKYLYSFPRASTCRV